MYTPSSCGPERCIQVVVIRDFVCIHYGEKLIQARQISGIGLVAEVLTLARVKGVPNLPVGGGIGVVILDPDKYVLLSYNPTNIL